MHIYAEVKNSQYSALYTAVQLSFFMCLESRRAEVMLAQKFNPSLQHQFQSHLRIDKLLRRENLADLEVGNTGSQTFPAFEYTTND